MRERERETETETDRQTDRQRQRQRDRDRDRETERQRQRDRETERDRDRQRVTGYIKTIIAMWGQRHSGTKLPVLFTKQRTCELAAKLIIQHALTSFQF